MRLLGIDYGEKKIGLAKSVGTLAVPLLVFRPTSLTDGVRHIVDRCREEEIDQIVVGLPLGLSGDHTPQTEQTLIFIEHLRAAVSIPITTCDERLSSRGGGQMLAAEGRTGDDDAHAAAWMLQGYLDGHPQS